MGAVLIFNSCKESKEEDQFVVPQLEGAEKSASSLKVNPLSYANILKAKASLASKDLSYANKAIDESRLYSYMRFDPNAVTGEMVSKLDADSTIQIMDFPFANAELYTDAFALDETKAKQLADGNLYIVVKKNTPTEKLFFANPALKTVVLDELYLPSDEDTTLLKQALKEGGYPEQKLFGLCLFKQPKGFVRYLDQETNAMVAVPNIQVWALVFGIKIPSYTNSNGYYTIPYKFSVGTIIGTKAQNFRVNIKPFNTVGGFLRVIPQLTLNFIVGSVHIAGWRGSCALRDDVNIEFRNHNQGRFWAQTLHSVALHDAYSRQDNISSAPFRLTIYAHWADAYGAGSAPMLGHVSALNLAGGVLSSIFNTNVTLNAPNLFNLLTGLLPDVTVSSGNVERIRHSTRLMHTCFHELGHASQFRRVSSTYWIPYITNILATVGSPCGGYGCGNELFFGRTQVGEAWAEFIGTAHARRWHPNGQKVSTFFLNQFVRYDRALEEERWFANNWIGTGVFHDLMDVNNTLNEENNWDFVGGMTIRQLYEVHNPSVTSMCLYRFRLFQLYPFLNRAQVDEIFRQNDITTNNNCLL
jgi:hypothetical protein